MNAALQLPLYQNRRHVLIHNQSVGDIITGILQTHSKYTADYDKIALSFAGRDAVQIARNVYDYLKKNTFYVIESDTRQTLRSPSAILALGQNPRVGLDCKSYSLFIAGVLAAWQRRGMNINWCYRFASYKIADKLPHHVFVVINPNTNHEIFVDPVLPTFNDKKQYHYKIDRKPMALYTVSGIGKTKRTREEKIKRRAQLKAKIKGQIKKKGKIFLKFNPATAAARNAILLIIKVNLFGLARKLFLARQKPGGDAKLKKFWESIGGKYASLIKNISTGIKHGKNRNDAAIMKEIATKNGSMKSNIRVSGIGDPVTASAVVTSTPILLKLVSLLKKLGIDPDKAFVAAKGVVKKVVDAKIDDIANKTAGKEEGTTSPGGDDMNMPDTASEALSPSDESTSDESSGDEMGAIPKKTLLLGGAALVAAYFIMKKK
tara:strand:- start:3027 stop:4325 length:1299 start_codon:yes stop_codon:yes gene_type:complete